MSEPVSEQDRAEVRVTASLTMIVTEPDGTQRVITVPAEVVPRE